MKNCECLAKCPFFNDKMVNMPTMANLLKKKYCEGDNSECARFIVFKALGKEKVPADLFPSQVEEAENILKAN